MTTAEWPACVRYPTSCRGCVECRVDVDGHDGPCVCDCPPPKRIQLRRTKGWRKPEGAIVVSRPSRWGNPWAVGDPHPIFGWPMKAFEVVDLYRSAAAPHALLLCAMDDSLRGHDLACWCPLDQPCHADVLLELANA